MNLTPWDDGVNNGVTKSNVENQDNTNTGDYFADLGNDLGQLVMHSNTAKEVNKVARTIAPATTSSKRPEKTTAEFDDSIKTEIEKIRNSKYKKINITSKLGVYNTYKNFLGNAASLYIGTLGRNTLTNVSNDIEQKLIPNQTVGNITNGITGGLGIANTINNLTKALKKIDPNRKVVNSRFSNKELLALNTANFYTIETNKPGKELGLINNEFQRDDKIYFNGSKQQLENNDLVLNTIIEKYFNGIKQPLENNDLVPSTIIETYRTDKEAFVNINNKILKEGTYDGENDYVDATNIDDINQADKEKLFKRVNDTYREIGGLYIEPFWSNNELNCYEIPFEFTPEITEGSLKAKYDAEDLLGRILPIRSYTSSDAEPVSIEATYIATSNSKQSNGEKYEIENQKDASQWTKGWMYDWTVDKLKTIETQYRSLVLPYVDKVNGIFIRPPIVRIKMRTGNYTFAKDLKYKNESGHKDSSNTKTQDLFSYPNIENCLEVTANFDSDEETAEKRYIVTSVDIKPLEQGVKYVYGNYDSSNNEQFVNIQRYGFKVSLSLSETTKNFLDTIPSYKEYMNSVAGSDFSVDKKGEQTLDKNKEDLHSLLSFKTYLNIDEILTGDEAEIAQNQKTFLTTLIDLEEAEAETSTGFMDLGGIRNE